ncbi:hypothetical protein A0H81_14368 [Grifola frondosa]|uniref:Uncharacterized protein n=1 Tax=Grifola frondosa TaxID=5627 RepID=A0A1C7LM19_GRIFR|nr:hypothetical protein A0H81_14368 [Grifola frondosa]
MSRIGSYSSGSERLDMSRQGSAWSTASSSSLGMSEVQRSVSKESTDWSESARYPLSWSNLECGVARNAFSGASQSFSQLSQTSFPLRSLAPSNSARGPVPTSEVPMAVPYDTELEASLLAAFSDNSSNHTGSANSINVDALIPPLTSTSLSSLSSSSRDTTLSDRLSFDSRSGSEFATPATSPGSVSFDVQMADASDRSTFTCASSAGSPEDFGNTLRDDLTGSDLSFNDVSKLTPPSSVCPSTMPCSGASSPSPSPNCCSPRIRSLSLDYDQAQLTEKATPHTKKSAHPLTNLFEELFGPEEEDKEEYTGRAPGV